MPLPAEVFPHLSESELRAKFRRCRHAGEKIRLQAILLRVQGKGTKEVAEICGFNPDWVRRLVRRYNARGPEALCDGRKKNGKVRMLNDALLTELLHAVVHGKPEGGGLWTGPKVAHWMSRKLGRPVSPQRAWDYLQRLGLSKQTPRPRHVRASAAAQKRFKKNSADG
jgi:transposase